MEDREFDNVYSIPANYTDSGKILGGICQSSSQYRQKPMKN